MNQTVRPWPALWALCIGFFMILVDTTIVAIANPVILAAFDADLTTVIWVTSAYLLAYAVPLLITGRLGDRFGPKRVYLVGLVVFTLASLACGLAGSIGMLIAARAVQGFGAALMTPQTMAIIARVFPPRGRGQAMGAWGAVGGLATLVGPILGGVLTDTVGWEWIFFVNVPVGIIAFVVAWRLVPNLDGHPHRFDWLGVALSGIGLFLLVFGIQEGEVYDWGVILGPITVWGLIVAGVALLVLFVVWQRLNRAEPLMPLSLFRDRNFSVANATIFLVGVGITAMPVPLAFYFQVARGLDPTLAALMLAPMAVVSGVLGPFVGRLSDRIGPRWVTFGAFVVSAVAMLWYSASMTLDAPFWLLLLPSALLGVGVSGMFGPLASTATRNLAHTQAGAGSGVYSTTRQMGSVIGSAVLAVLMNLTLAAQIRGFVPGTIHPGAELSADDGAGLATAMSQSLLLPAIAFAVCAVVVVFFTKPRPWGAPAAPTVSEPAVAVGGEGR
ncbi:DHA2 family efflux MFS transporter permease subunit [Microbacterium sp. EST19A]|uniref:DHA2 family efflux MFS transporter permease subunit n=1 Tax=Microbacterium sp. EST19A TaxID=2862681 RepID=UPI001CBC305F|nr:DHA2 family efflux MFS transporter permease subunit [Microbacterium sp. EST19A]